MAAGKLNLRIEKGATYKKRLVWRDKNKKPVVMTGFSALMQIRSKIGDPVLFELSSANGRIVFGNGGVIQLVLTPAETSSLDFEAGVYDLLIDAGTDSMRLIEGRVAVSPAVTTGAA